jgi:hypothetical protein
LLELALTGRKGPELLSLLAGDVGREIASVAPRQVQPRHWGVRQQQKKSQFARVGLFSIGYLREWRRFCTS